MRPCCRLSRALLIAALLVPSIASAVPRRGDLLVTDFNGSRVLLVRANTGAVEPLLPPSGSPNLLAQPTGIAVGSGGTIYVADAVGDRIVAIDPATGEQHFLRHTDFDPFGGGSYAITIEDVRALAVAPDLLFGDQLYATGLAGLSFASQGFLSGWTATLFHPSGTLADTTAIAVGIGFGPVPLYLSDPSSGLLLLPAGGACCEAPYLASFRLVGAELAFGVVDGVVFAGSDPVGPHLYFTERIIRDSDSTCLPSGDPRVAELTATGVVSVSVGGLLRCPSLLAGAPGIDRLHVVDYDFTGGISARIVRIERSHAAAPWTQSVLTPDLPLGTTAGGLAVFVPEPDSARASSFAAAALLALAARSRRFATPRREIRASNARTGGAARG